MCIDTHKTKSPTKLGKKKIPYTIVLDWLEVTLKGIAFHEYNGEGQLAEVITLDNNVHLERQIRQFTSIWKSSKSYRAIYSVYLNGEEVATLLTGNKFGQVEHSQLKLSNHLLYSSRWRPTMEAILEATQTEINNFRRVDIAIDGRGFMAQHLERREAVRAGKLKKVGRAKTDLKEVGQYECEGFYVGLTRAGKTLTGYEKGLQLLDARQKGKNHKPYIVDMWMDNGLVSDPEEIEDIERLELRLTTERLNKIQDLSLDNLEDPAFLAGLFELSCENFYQWVEVTEDTNTTRAKAKAVLHAVRWELLKGKQVIRKKIKKCKNALWGARMTISHLMREYYVNVEYAFGEVSQKAHHHFLYCQKMAEVYGISDWFNRKLSDWEKDREHKQSILEAIRAAQFRPV